MAGHRNSDQSRTPFGAVDVDEAVDDGGSNGDDPPGDGRRTETVVLNGLDGLVNDRPAVLADPESERILRDAYRSVTAPATRRTVAAALDRLAPAVQSMDVDDDAAADASGDDRLLAEVVADVADALADRDATFVVDHDVPLDLSTHSTAVYRFFGTHDPESLQPLIDNGIAALERGAEATRDGDPATAADAFEDAAEAATDSDIDTAVRTLCAWAHHRAGDDDRALEFVEAALLRDENAWPARLVGVAADHSTPDWFRAGRLASEAYLRVRAAVPEGASVRAAAVDGEGAERWLDGNPDCFRAPRLPAEGRLRIRLRGPPGRLPALYAYYLAVGVVEPESARPRTVEQILLDGPASGESSERVRIRVS